MNLSIRCLSEFWTKKRQNWRHGGPESRRSEPPRRFSTFQQITTNPGFCMNPSILSAALPIRISNKKRQNWPHGGLECKSSEPPRWFSPFWQITTHPGYCVNPSIPSAWLPIRILNKKKWNWRHGGPESRRSVPPQRFSPFQQITTNPGYCMNQSIPSARLPIRILHKIKT